MANNGFKGMRNHVEVIKARWEVTRALSGVSRTTGLLWKLPASTALELQRIFRADLENGKQYFRSVIQMSTLAHPNRLIHNLCVYATSSDTIRTITSNPETDDFDKKPGQIMVWLNHHYRENADITPADYGHVLELISRWNNPASHFSVSLLNLDGEGLLDFIMNHPEHMDRLVEVMNQSPSNWPGTFIPDGPVMIEQARSVPSLQEGAL